MKKDLGKNQDMQGRWLDMCRDAGIDPREVRLIYDRYDAYRGFTERNTGSSLAVGQWFRFYHLEKNSEGLQAGAPASGCSADGDAVNNACLSQPGSFLAVLEAYDTTRRDPAA